MFSARAYSFRQKSRLAISLSWVAGYTNVIVFTACGVVVSHVTGTSTMLAKAAAERSAHEFLLFGGLWLSFFSGAICSALMTETARRTGSASKYVFPLAIEAVLLTLVACGLHGAWPIEHASIAIKEAIACTAAFAMGLQNATITKISGAVIRTTHLTGVTTDLGIEGVQYLLWFRDRLAGRGRHRVARMIRVSRRHPEFLRVLLLASIFCSFVFGAGIGMLMYFRFDGVALAFPVSFLLWMIYIDWRQPIADVREIDPLSDRELQLHGIVKALLPPEMGIWRVLCAHGGWHKPPDFEQWVDIMPRHWQVVILSLSPLMRFNSNSLLNLGAAARKLRSRDRHLVLAGVTPVQYQAICATTTAEVIHEQNICPDLEFAIARGIDLVRSVAEKNSRSDRTKTELMTGTRRIEESIN